MIRVNSPITKNSNVKTYLYHSPESDLSIRVKRYTLDNIFKKFNQDTVRKFISQIYFLKTKRRLKHSAYKTTNYIYKKLMTYYFQWVIEECIKGNIVKLFGQNLYIAKVTNYIPTNIEKKRISKLYKPFIVKDFYKRYYRIQIYVLKGNYYIPTDYFFTIRVEHKEELQNEINNDKNYVANISI